MLGLSYDPTSPILSFMFVRYSGDLIVHVLKGGRGRVSGYEVIIVPQLPGVHRSGDVTCEGWAPHMLAMLSHTKMRSGL